MKLFEITLLLCLLDFSLILITRANLIEELESHSSEENKNEIIDENNFTKKECLIMCSRFGSLVSKSCKCLDLMKIDSFKNKRQYTIDCQVLCFIGQGGKACNCNYAPFVGK